MKLIKISSATCWSSGYSYRTNCHKSGKKGYATMALRGLISYCFSTLQLHQIYCNILSDNSESMELFKKLGFIEIGKKREWIKTNEGYLDEYMFQLLNINS